MTSTLTSPRPMRRRPAIRPVPGLLCSLVSALLPQRNHVAERARDVGDDRQIDGHGFVDRAAVDVDVHLARIGRERIQTPGHAVVEPRAERDDEVGLLQREHRGNRSVHARHAEVLTVRVGEGAARHEGRDDGGAGELGELRLQIGRAVRFSHDALPYAGSRPCFLAGRS